MKLCFLLSYWILFIHSAFSQQIERQVYGPNGASVKNGEIWLEYTIGEMAVQNFINSDLNLQEGFHQVFGKNIILTHPTVMKVYPNPAITYLQIDIPDEMVNEAFYNFTEITGKVLFEKESSNTKLMANNTVIDMVQFPSGIYVLSIFNAIDNSTTNFRIVHF